MNQPEHDVDPRRVRIGLAIVTLVFLGALVLIAVVDEPVARTMMVVVLLIALVRAALLIRTIRRDRS